MNEPNNGLPGKFSNRPGQINRLVKLEPIKRDKAEATEPNKPYERDPRARSSSDDGPETNHG